MRLSLLSLVLFASSLGAGEPMCGTSPENDLRVRGIHERTRARLAASATESIRAATLREGAFYVENDRTITPGYRPFDLTGQSLVFTPAGSAAFTMRREPLQYVEPAGEPVRDFTSGPALRGARSSVRVSALRHDRDAGLRLRVQRHHPDRAGRAEGDAGRRHRGRGASRAGAFA